MWQRRISLPSFPIFLLFPARPFEVSPLTPSPLFSFPFPSFSSTPFSSPISTSPSLPLEMGPIESSLESGELGSAVTTPPPSGAWGRAARAPAGIEFGAFSFKIWASGGNNVNDFHEVSVHCTVFPTNPTVGIEQLAGAEPGICERGGGSLTSPSFSLFLSLLFLPFPSP